MPRKAKSEKVVKEVEKAVEEVMEDLGIEVGKITHYFDKIGVAVVELADSLNVGDLIRIKGVTTDFKQKVSSMQVEGNKVEIFLFILNIVDHKDYNKLFGYK